MSARSHQFENSAKLLSEALRAKMRMKEEKDAAGDDDDRCSEKSSELGTVAAARDRLGIRNSSLVQLQTPKRPQGRRRYRHWMRKHRVLFKLVYATVALGLAVLLFLYIYFLVFENWNNVPLRVGISVGVSVVCGALLMFGMAFSNRVRCLTIVTFPGLFTNRSRTVLLSICLGILLGGPIQNIVKNINEVNKSISCGAELVKVLVVKMRNESEQNAEVMMKVKSTIQKLVEQARKENIASKTGIIEKLKSAASTIQTAYNVALKVQNGWRIAKCVLTIGIKCDKEPPKKDIKEYILDKVKDEVGVKGATLPDVEENLKKKLGEIMMPKDIAEVRRAIKDILKAAFAQIRSVSGILRKLLYLSILLIIYDCWVYLNRYYADNNFDNQRIDDNLRSMWQEKKKKKGHEKEKLMPLRNWEKKHYDYRKPQRRISFHRTSPKMSLIEVRHMLLSMVFSLIVAVIVMAVLVGDMTLYHSLDIIDRFGEVAISFEGVDQGITLQSKIKAEHFNFKVSEVNLTNAACLPKPQPSRSSGYITVTAVLVFCFLSCTIQAYALRLRPLICNHFYPTRAQQRADHLYRKIASGRIQRKVKFHRLVEDEHSKRERKREFALCHLPQCDRRPICPTCDERITDNGYSYKMKQGKQIELCSDCAKDFGTMKPINFDIV